MPPVASCYCKYEGCTEKRYIYPSGERCQYCKTHMKHRKAKARKGQPSMTGQMHDVLVYLRTMKAQDCLWVQLTYPFAHGKVLQSLQQRDWIISSHGSDGWRHTITGRGEQALDFFKRTQQHRDGLCPRCRQHPRHIRSSGQRDPYCIKCLREKSRTKYATGKGFGDPNRPCSRCQKRGRHQYPNGKLSTYCKHCERVNRRRNSRKHRRLILKQILAGGPIPMCKKCTERPCRVFVNSFSELCDYCRLPYMRKLKLNRRLKIAGLQPIT